MAKWTWFIPFLALLMAGCAQKSYESMGWQTDPVRIDGQSGEWTFPLRYYDSKTKLTFYACNDTKRLYLVFATGDEMARVKALASGLKIEIDTAAGNKYPMSMTCTTLPPDMPRGGGAGGGSPRVMGGQRDTSHQHHMMRVLPVWLQFSGFKKIPDGRVSMPNPYGIEVALLGRDEAGRLFCEMSIPFADFYKDSITEADDRQVFSIRITLDKLEAPSGSASGSHFSMGSGGGGMGGGGMGGGMGGGGYGGGGMGGGGYGGGGMGGGGYGGGGMGGGGYGGGGMGGGGMGGGMGNGGGGYGGDGMSPGGMSNSELFIKTSFVVKLKPGIP